MILNEAILKAHLGAVQKKWNWATVETFAKTSEREFVERFGRALYEEVATLEAGHDLRDLTEAVLAWRVLDLALPHMKFSVGDLGIIKQGTDKSVAVTKWEYIDSREEVRKQYDNHLEALYAYLEEAEPQGWTTSRQYERRQRLLIRSSRQLADYLPTLEHSSRFFDQLTTYLRRAEDLYLCAELTPDVVHTLKTERDTHETLFELACQTVAHFGLFEAYPYLPISISEKGLRRRDMRDGTEEILPTEREQRDHQRRQLMKDGQLYLGKLRKALQAQATETLFPTYFLKLNRPRQWPEDDFSDTAHVLV